MHIVDGYWTNYKHPENVDRVTQPPVLNFDLIKRINGRGGEDPTPFDWKGQIVDVENLLTHPVALNVDFDTTRDGIYSAASTLADIYHKDNKCSLNARYLCRVNKTGKCLQIMPCEVQMGDMIEEEKYEQEIPNHSQTIGIAMDLLFTAEGKVDENTDAQRDNLAYFCIFSKNIYSTHLLIRKEVDIMLKLADGHLPVELKTRTWLGMNKKAFSYQLLPKLMTRCYLTDCFTLMVAVRDEKNGTAIDKVLFFEDVRDIAPAEYKARASYYEHLINRIMQARKKLSCIAYNQNQLYLMKGSHYGGNINAMLPATVPFIPREDIKPDLIICDEDILCDLEPTLSDLCTKRNWTNGNVWSISWAAPYVFIVVWKFESLLKLLHKHVGRSASYQNTVVVFMHNGEENPSDEEVEFALQYYVGAKLKIEIRIFEDECDLEEMLEAEDVYENCNHAMVLLGESHSLPVNFAVRCTDVFKIKTFPRMEFLELTTLPDKIAVIGSIRQCVSANEKLSKLKMFEGYEEYTYFFMMDMDIVPNMNLKNMIFVSPVDDMLSLLRTYGFPYCL